MAVVYSVIHCKDFYPFSSFLRKSMNTSTTIVIVDSCTYMSLLQACIHRKCLVEGKVIHGRMNKTGFIPDILLRNTLSNMYVKCGSMADARQMFDKMHERNVCSWSIMISSYARHGPPGEALALFRQMQRTDIQPNHFTFAGVLPACAGLQALEQGTQIHQQIIRSGYEAHIFVSNALLEMYIRCGRIENACHVFDKMPEPDMVSWTTMIVGYSLHGLVDEAWRLFNEMPGRDVASWNAMISGFAQNGLIDEALKLFNEMPRRNTVSWNAMITGCARNRLMDEALMLFEEMPKRDAISWNAIIAGFVQNGLVDKALKLFREMPRPSVVSWNAMISGLAQNGHAIEALKLFQQMQLAGVKPNSTVFPTVLSPCADLAALEQGIEMHEKIIECGFQSDVVVTNALLDMYTKCAKIEKARDLFDKMNQRSVVSWTAMIAGYAMHGYSKEALELFEQMKHSSINPNRVTFVGVLSACSHAGLVNKGYQYFSAMTSNYGITPAMDHYRCMVDLLGRVGQLHEAHNFIKKMPVKPDVTVWNSLLSACRVYNNIDLAECLAEQIFELDYVDPSTYMLLSNIYAAYGRWDDIQKMRKMMSDRGIKKTPSCSWIEVNKLVHTFLDGDSSHPQTNEIYAKLERLCWEMKVSGYIPDTRCME